MFSNLDPAALAIHGLESEIIETALTYGFEGIDLDIVDFAARAEHYGLPYTRRFIDSAQIRLGAFKLPFDWDTDDEQFRKNLQKLEFQAAVAAEVGCTRCIAIVPPAGDKRPYHENFEFHRARFTEICRVLQTKGVRLGLGFRAAPNLRGGQAYVFIYDLDALALLVKMIDLPNLGFLCDPWNWELSGATVAEIANLGIESIVAVHLADFPSPRPQPEQTTEADRVLPGTGELDLVTYLQTLRRLGYNGPVTPVPDKKPFIGLRRETATRQAAEAMRKLWEALGLRWQAPRVPARMT
ncbi:MAG: sugar phosphate isomerase/epimerase [Thermoguttaceae bacterium]|nr:sugar phosphate isomerase/epimerase [Thermoguttaceae bacterium]MDW8078565.1 sugar phosphate isomerase/epimerase family protein [Thermoguttaceae bacterium]